MQKQQQMMVAVGGAVALLLIAGGGFVAWSKFGKAKNNQITQEEPKKRKVSEPVNAIAVAERPYVKLAPQADGKHIDMTVVALKKPATEVEYEFEYQAGSLLQAQFDTLALPSLPATGVVKLYSCSAGGACTYHKEIKGGNVLLKFKGDQNYALKSEWRYLEGLAKDPQVSSKDAKFQLSSPEFKKASVAIVYNAPGYPEGLTGTPVSELYALGTPAVLKGQGELTIRANEEGAHTIMGWDGSAWKSFTTKADGKMFTATVDLMELYVVVKK